MNAPYEILLRWRADGTFSGGHTIRFNDAGQPGLPLAIGEDASFPWQDAAAEINTATLQACKSAQADQAKAETDLVQAQAERDKALARVTEVEGFVAKTDELIKTKATLPELLAALHPEIATQQLPEKERKIADLQKQKVEIDRIIDQINNPPPPEEPPAEPTDVSLSISNSTIGR